MTETAKVSFSGSSSHAARFVLWHFRAEPLRLALSVAVFAGVTSLVFLFAGIHHGLLADLEELPGSLPATLVGLEAGVERFGLASSSLPQLSREQAESVPGVLEASPLTKAPVIVTWNRRRTPSILIARDAWDGWPRVERGRPPAEERDLLVDASLAARHGVAIGDEVDLLGEPFRVVGTSEGTVSPFSPYLFVNYDGLLFLLLEAGLSPGADDESLLSALLVSAANADPAGLRAQLERAVPDADWRTPRELARADAALGQRLMGPVLDLLTALASVIGALAMAVLRYTDIQSRTREIGIARALGATSRWLGATLVLGGLATVALAVGPAIGLAALLARGIHVWDPLWSPLVFAPLVLVRGVALATLAALVGSLLPLRRLNRLDPVLVFER